MKLRFIPNHKCLEISGHETPRAFYDWRRRWNIKNPQHRIIFRERATDYFTLGKALLLDAARHSGGGTDSEALAMAEADL